MALDSSDYHTERLPAVSYSYVYNAPAKCPIAPPEKFVVSVLKSTDLSALTHLAKSLAQPGMISAAKPMNLPRCEYSGSLSVPFSLLSSFIMIASATSSGSNDGAMKGNKPPQLGKRISEKRPVCTWDGKTRVVRMSGE
jgi:hypothetical protein